MFLQFSNPQRRVGLCQTKATHKITGCLPLILRWARTCSCCRRLPATKASRACSATISICWHMDLIIKRRRTAVSDLFKKQAVSGSGVTNAQINQAIADYDAIKAEARRLGIAVPEGDFTLGTPEFSKE